MQFVDNLLYLNKLRRVLVQYAISTFRNMPIFLHIAPTLRCNFQCGYCYQTDSRVPDMDFDKFKNIINQLHKHGLSIVSFTGGEPFLWPHIIEAIVYCNKRNLFTHVSTNGSLLTKKIIDQVKKAGLSYLSVSIDSVGFNNGSKKTIQAKPDLMRLLTYARRENKIQVSFNTVLAKNNIIEVFKLFELSKAEDIPMSVGVVVMPPNNRDGRDRCLSFNKSDKELVESLARQILAYKNRGYRIIEPEEYFKGIWDYLNQSSRWDCKKTKSRTIQVHPSGKVYWCSKLNQLSKYNAYEMDKNNFAHFLKQLSHKIEECNKNCFSNCAFDSYFYQKNKLAFLEMIWRGFILNH